MGFIYLWTCFEEPRMSVLQGLLFSLLLLFACTIRFGNRECVSSRLPLHASPFLLLPSFFSLLFFSFQLPLKPEFDEAHLLLLSCTFPYSWIDHTHPYFGLWMWDGISSGRTDCIGTLDSHHQFCDRCISGWYAIFTLFPLADPKYPPFLSYVFIPSAFAQIMILLRYQIWLLAHLSSTLNYSIDQILFDFRLKPIFSLNIWHIFVFLPEHSALLSFESHIIDTSYLITSTSHTDPFSL